jgi:hypothetical protein
MSSEEIIEIRTKIKKLEADIKKSNDELDLLFYPGEGGWPGCGGYRYDASRNLVLSKKSNFVNSIKKKVRDKRFLPSLKKQPESKILIFDPTCINQPYRDKLEIKVYWFTTYDHVVDEIASNYKTRGDHKFIECISYDDVNGFSIGLGS